jgi:ornithine carbamoyltransferase
MPKPRSKKPTPARTRAAANTRAATSRAPARPAKPAPAAPITGQDLLTLTTLSRAQVLSILATADALKADRTLHTDALKGRAVVLLFEKPSLRTRLSFEVGIARLGGHAIYMDHAAQRLGERESIADYGRNLERWLDAIVARVFKHETIAELAAASRAPVINGLCNRYHPCQALADLLTLRQHRGTLDGARLAYIGDGNNVCHSLMHCCAMLGVDVTVITPEGHEPAEDVVAETLALARDSGSRVLLTHDPDAVEDHDAVYTDVWVSMGQADEAGKRMKTFQAYQVNSRLMDIAGHDALFMHCLPARRGVEVTDDVIDSPASVVYDQAENRMHAQNALLVHLFAGA